VTGPRLGAREASTLRWLAFPALVAMLFAGLVALNLNGSSISLLVPRGERSGVLAGAPRAIRSDELLVETPIAISSAEQGFPESPWIGLAPTDLAAVAHGGPTRDWSTLFKPQDWGYLVLGPSRGLAFSWWWAFAVSLLGCYALFGMLTKSRGLAALLAVAATFTPYNAWWTAPSPALFLGYAAAIGALLIAAWSAPGWRIAAACSLGAAVLGGAFALALYPPWQVSLVWVVGLICLGVALDRRLAWRRIAWTTAATASLSALALVLWYLGHSATLAAVVGTIYPGNRVSLAGGADLASLLDAPLNFWLADGPGATLGTTPGAGPYANLSEAASTWFSLPILFLVMAGAVMALTARFRARQATAQGEGTAAPPSPNGPLRTLTLVSIAALLLLAWAFLPVPNELGLVTLMNRVEPSRVTVALGLAALVQVTAASRIQPRPAWSTAWLVAGAGLTGLVALWASGHLPWDASLVPAPLVVASGMVIGTSFALLTSSRWATAGGLLLSVVAVVSWSLVNPLQRGLGGVVTDPLVTELRTVATTGSNPRVEVFGDLNAVARVRIAGLQSLGGTTLNPDAELMSQLVPQQEALWNNYVQYVWSPLPSGSRATITQVKGTFMTLAIDPCDPVLLRYADPGWAVSAQPLADASCLDQVAVVPTRDGTEFRIYRVARP
jgi:hypothetical protein